MNKNIRPIFDRNGNPVTVILNANQCIVEPIHIGDIYVFNYDISTRMKHIHNKGSVLTVQNKSKETYYSEISESGFNWLCQTQFGVSYWTTLEQCISRGMLTRIHKGPID